MILNVATKITPLALANTFIERHGRKVNGIQHMKLQKLCYYAHGWWLALQPEPSEPFLTERPQVWKYGPVFNSLYNVLKPFGKRPIKEPKSDNPFVTPDVVQNAEVIKLIDWIWNRYGQYTAETLSDMTHEEGTPWRNIAKENHYRVRRDLPIDNRRVKDYFNSEYKKLAPSAT